MGVPYIFEVVSFLFADIFRNDLWFAADMVKSMQGSLLFILFVLRESTLNVIYDKLCLFKCGVIATETPT